MKDYKLSEIKKICEKRHFGNPECDPVCHKCEIGRKKCFELFGDVFPDEWELDEKDGEEE